MSKNARWFVAFIALLLICGLAFLTRPRLAPHPTTSGRRSAAAPSPMAAADVPVVTAAPARADTGAEQAKRERLQTESRELKQANTALEAALQKAEADKERAERKTEVMAQLNDKLLEPDLAEPRALPEAASLMGQILVDTANFKQKWGDAIPAAGSPEADEYNREQETLVSRSAALMKFFTDEDKAVPLGQPDGLARFQAASLAGALGLRDDQAQGVNTALDGYYQQFFTQGLSMSTAPQTGPDASQQWRQQRDALSQQAYGAVLALLTPEQATAFRSIYPTAQTYLTEINVGGLMTLTH